MKRKYVKQIFIKIPSQGSVRKIWQQDPYLSKLICNNLLYSSVFSTNSIVLIECKQRNWWVFESTLVCINFAEKIKEKEIQEKKFRFICCDSVSLDCCVRLKRRSFPVNLAKFLRTIFYRTRPGDFV